MVSLLPFEGFKMEEIPETQGLAECIFKLVSQSLPAHSCFKMTWGRPPSMFLGSTKEILLNFRLSLRNYPQEGEESAFHSDNNQ